MTDSKKEKTERERAAPRERFEPGKQLPVDDTAPEELSDRSMLKHSIKLARDKKKAG
jgi:hypothetical protein